MTNHAPAGAAKTRADHGSSLLKCVVVGERSVGRCYSARLISSYWASNLCFLASIGASGVDFGLLQKGAARGKYPRGRAVDATSAAASFPPRRYVRCHHPQERRQKPTQNNWRRRHITPSRTDK